MEHQLTLPVSARGPPATGRDVDAGTLPDTGGSPMCPRHGGAGLARPDF